MRPPEEFLEKVKFQMLDSIRGKKEFQSLEPHRKNIGKSEFPISGKKRIPSSGFQYWKKFGIHLVDPILEKNIKKKFIKKWIPTGLFTTITKSTTLLLPSSITGTNDKI